MKEQMLKYFLWNSDEWIREDKRQLGQLLREPGSALHESRNQAFQE